MQNDFRQIKKNLTGEYLKDCEFRIPDSLPSTNPSKNMADSK